VASTAAAVMWAEAVGRRALTRNLGRQHIARNALRHLLQHLAAASNSAWRRVRIAAHAPLPRNALASGARLATAERRRR